MSIPNSLQRTLDWFKAARPVYSEKHFNSQHGVHFEEVAEMIATLEAENGELGLLLANAKKSLNELADYLKSAGDEAVMLVRSRDRIDHLDSIVDQIVTGTGCAQIQSYKLIDALDAVNTQNFSKFDADGNPIFAEGGKIMKGPYYQKADLTPFV